MRSDTAGVHLEEAAVSPVLRTMADSTGQLSGLLRECVEGVLAAASDPGCAAGTEGRQFMDTVREPLGTLFGAEGAAPMDLGAVANGQSGPELWRILAGVAKTVVLAESAVRDLGGADEDGGARIAAVKTA